MSKLNREKSLRDGPTAAARPRAVKDLGAGHTGKNQTHENQESAKGIASAKELLHSEGIINREVQATPEVLSAALMGIAPKLPAKVAGQIRAIAHLFRDYDVRSNAERLADEVWAEAVDILGGIYDLKEITGDLRTVTDRLASTVEESRNEIQTETIRLQEAAEASKQAAETGQSAPQPGSQGPPLPSQEIRERMHRRERQVMIVRKSMEGGNIAAGAGRGPHGGKG